MLEAAGGEPGVPPRLLSEKKTTKSCVQQGKAINSAPPLTNMT